MCPDSWISIVYFHISSQLLISGNPGRQRGTGTCIKLYYFCFYNQRLLHFNYVRASYCCWVLGTRWQRSIPASKDWFLVFKKLALSELSLGWLMYSSWWTPSPDCWLAWCSWGGVWGVCSVVLGWCGNRIYLYVVSHLVVCHPSILVVY